MQLFLNLSFYIAIFLVVLFVASLVFIVLSGQVLLTHKQLRRIAKLKISSLSDQPMKKKRLFNYSFTTSLNTLIAQAGFEDSKDQLFSGMQIIAIVCFVLSWLLGLMLGFPLVGSFIFAVITTVLSPLVPYFLLMYFRASRNTLISEEIFVVMTHIVDAVEAAGKPLQAALENASLAAPILQPYLRRFLNTYLMLGLPKAVDSLREAIKLPEMDLFLDLIAHGFEHTTQELTRYFQSESDSYHELEVAAKERRMERREVLFDILLVFPFVLGFLLMIYPVCMQGMQAITRAF